MLCHAQMTPTRQGSFRFFRFSGITVFVHWTWFAVAYYILSSRSAVYASPFWNIAEYCGLFLLVLLHEFGHSLACRQTGGSADQIILWPLGGVAFVAPPNRPGAVLWSIAAGPLVNAVLIPVFLLLGLAADSGGLALSSPNLYSLLQTLSAINLGLLIFNMLPIYPLDGGQILRALLWFRVGPIRSLKVATGVGFAGAGALAVLAFSEGSFLLGIVAAFMVMHCRAAWQYARVLSARQGVPPG